VYLIPGAGVMAVTTDGQGIVVGLTSFDGGSTWRRLSPPPGETTFDDYVFQDAWAQMQVVFPNTNPPQGTGLAMSSDGGVHWKPVNVPNPV
jgi:hypothetical protein